MDVTAIITAILAMVEQLLPLITSSSNVTLIDTILSTLIQMMPFIIKEVQTLYTPVKNIIAALSANPATTADQLASLQTLDAQTDAAFDAMVATPDPTPAPAAVAAAPAAPTTAS